MKELLLQAKEDIEFVRKLQRAKRFVKMFKNQTGATINSISFRKIDKYIKLFSDLISANKDIKNLFDSILDTQGDSKGEYI